MVDINGCFNDVSGPHCFLSYTPSTFFPFEYINKRAWTNNTFDVLQVELGGRA